MLFFFSEMCRKLDFLLCYAIEIILTFLEAVVHMRMWHGFPVTLPTHPHIPILIICPSVEQSTEQLSSCHDPEYAPCPYQMISLVMLFSCTCFSFFLESIACLTLSNLGPPTVVK